MSIAIKNLTKIYGSQKAVNNLSFETKKGEILGFLGPNGAGKSTTMKIITGYLSPSSGSVNVAGIDVLKDPLLAKSKIGYLPESNPLYKDMYIKEYLNFVAKIYKIKNPKNRVNQLIEEVGLTVEQKKKIHQLSKGYKQRVGIAQALMNNPEVLILDEPTSGLDPNQLVEIRSLIKRLASDKTVIFSSHIMQEVESLCDNVLIINRGEKIVHENINVLTQNFGKKVKVNVTWQSPIAIEKLVKNTNIHSAKLLTDNTYEIYLDNKEARASIFNISVQENWTILEMTTQKSEIESIFRELTAIN